MADAPLGDKKKTEGESENLKLRQDNEKVETAAKDSKVTRTPITEVEKKHRLLAYRPTHKATFIGIAVVVIILGVNAAVLGFLLKKEGANQKAISEKGVTISPATLSKLGVNDSQIGSSNEILTVDPNAQFNSKLTVGGDVSIGGQLHLNSTFNASGANISQLQAGNTTVNSLNINGNATASTLGVRGNFVVNGAAQFQNAVTVAQLLSVASSEAVTNNLSVGGELSASSVAAGSLALSGSIAVGGHILTSGAAPSAAVGSAAGSYGSVSVSGDDIAGTVYVSTGAGASSGLVAHITFHAGYTKTPVVVIAPLNAYAAFYVASVSASGFDIECSSAAALSPGAGYQINYLVEE